MLHVRERPDGCRRRVPRNQRARPRAREKLIRAPATSIRRAWWPHSSHPARYYRDEGFSNARVTAATDTAAGCRVLLRFRRPRRGAGQDRSVNFGRCHRVFEPKKLRKAMKSKARWFLGGGDVKEENLVEDRERLERYYRSRGYRDMRVVSADFDSGSAANRVVLKVTVDEGPRYRFGRVDWSGNKVLATAELEKGWPKSKHDWYDVSRIEKAQGAAYAAYAEQGYLYLNVEPRETVRDSAVDLSFEIGEGQPSHVRYVVISGNKATREHVIRREIDIPGGQLPPFGAVRARATSAARLFETSAST